MWKRKDLKERAKDTVAKNYSHIVAVCFILAIFAGSYPTATTLFEQNNHSAPTYNVVQDSMTTSSSAKEIVNLLENIGLGGAQSWQLDPVRSMLDPVVNAVFNSNNIIIGIVRAVNSFLDTHATLLGFLLILAVVLRLAYRIFVANVLTVGECRFFLETRTYTATPIHRTMYLYRLRRIVNPALVMVERDIRLFLWWCTIVGGAVKHYEYLMVPYILAENPTTDRRTAFALSREMMNGQKWQAAVLDMSFLGWALLRVASFGLSGILYGNGYVAATRSELYMVLRSQIKASDSAEAHVLVDHYLDCAHPTTPVYPIEDYPIPAIPKAVRRPVNADRKYSLCSCILMFFSFAGIGWLWEVALHFLDTGDLVNRGTMLGPWLPIYGSCGVLFLLLFRRTIKRPVLTFNLVMLVASVVEYATSWGLEMMYGYKWWDYSQYFLNLNGRICLAGAMTFGFAGCVGLYYVAPRFDDAFNRIPRRLRWIIALVLCALFALDLVHSAMHPNMGKGVSDFGVVEWVVLCRRLVM